MKKGSVSRFFSIFKRATKKSNDFTSESKAENLHIKNGNARKVLDIFSHSLLRKLCTYSNIYHVTEYEMEINVPGSGNAYVFYFFRVLFSFQFYCLVNLCVFCCMCLSVCVSEVKFIFRVFSMSSVYHNHKIAELN